MARRKKQKKQVKEALDLRTLGAPREGGRTRRGIWGPCAPLVFHRLHRRCLRCCRLLYIGRNRAGQRPTRNLPRKHAEVERRGSCRGVARRGYRIQTRTVVCRRLYRARILERAVWISTSSTMAKSTCKVSRPCCLHWLWPCRQVRDLGHVRGTRRQDHANRGPRAAGPCDSCGDARTPSRQAQAQP